MTLQLPPNVDQLIKQHMASGHYASEEELLIEALQALDRHKEDLAAIQAGIEDMEAGRVVALHDVADEIRRKLSFRTDA